LKKNIADTTAKPPKKRLFAYFWYDFVKVTGIIPGLIWIRPKVIRVGQKCPKGGVLISSNHPTFLDPITILTAFPWRRPHCLVTKDLYKNRLMTFLLKRMHCIQVDKDNFSMASFHETVDCLKDGRAVVIFPEGQVNRGDGREVQAFKSGAILMAHRANAPILPVYIVKREKWYRTQRVVVGEPFDVKAAVGPIPTMEQMERVTGQLREKELELKRFYEETYSS
jgi:1-acyl-sn-glycerol-3-phosphate acyltransferase